MSSSQHAMLAELLGWASWIVLAATMSRQIYVEWRTRAVMESTKWPFLGQMCASLGFTAYSLMLGNRVFTAASAVMAAVALLGESISLRNRRVRSRNAVIGSTSRVTTFMARRRARRLGKLSA